jgi:hypothetical protein
MFLRGKAASCSSLEDGRLLSLCASKLEEATCARQALPRRLLGPAVTVLRCGRGCLVSLCGLLDERQQTGARLRRLGSAGARGAARLRTYAQASRQADAALDRFRLTCVNDEEGA